MLPTFGLNGIQFNTEIVHCVWASFSGRRRCLLLSSHKTQEVRVWANTGGGWVGQRGRSTEWAIIKKKGELEKEELEEIETYRNGSEMSLILCCCCTASMG